MSHEREKERERKRARGEESRGCCWPNFPRAGIPDFPPPHLLSSLAAFYFPARKVLIFSRERFFRTDFQRAILLTFFFRSSRRGELYVFERSCARLIRKCGAMMSEGDCMHGSGRA